MAILGSAPGIIVGVGVGEALAAALGPAVEVERQKHWLETPRRVLEPTTLARLYAQGGIELGAAEHEAKLSGYDLDKLHALAYLEQQVPGTADLLFLWRLGVVEKPEWERGMVKLGHRQDWIDHLAELFTVPLTAQEAAVAVQRSLIPNQGQLPFTFADAAAAVYADWNATLEAQLGTSAPSGHKVTPMPVVDLDAYKAAQAYGIGPGELDVLTRAIGLPASPDLAARMVFRELITAEDFVQAIAEGNTRIEWAPALFDGFRQIITGEQAAELELRGYLTRDERLAETVKHGLSERHSDLLYDLLGRGINIHQVLIGERRGGVYDGPIDGIPEAFLATLRRGNLRPEYYNLAYAGRETFPSYFVVRALLRDGAITPARAEELFLGLGWPEDVAKAAPAALAGGASSAGKELTKAELLDEYAGGFITQAEYQSGLETLGYTGAELALELELGDARRLKTYREKVVEAVHTGYLEHEVDDAEALADLATVNVVGQAAQDLVALWSLERRYTRRRLTQAQVVKAYTRSLIPQADALARLQDFGLSAADAQVRLDEG